MKRQSRWWTLDRSTLCASFAISIGNPRCYSPSLDCQIDWGSSEFQRFEFSVADTLRVHNYLALGHPRYGTLSVEQALEICAEEGADWISQHTRVIDELLRDKPRRIVTWEHWKSMPMFEAYLARLEALHSADRDFRNCVSSDTSGFLSRQGRSMNSLSAAQKSTLAKYILEELAACQVRAELQPTVNIYPGGMLKTYRRMRLINGIPDSLANRHYIYVELRENMDERPDRAVDEPPVRREVT